MTKTQVLASLSELPDKFELDDLFERLLFLQHLENRLTESDRDEVVTFEEARQRLTQPTQRAA